MCEEHRAFGRFHSAARFCPLRLRGRSWGTVIIGA
jgi:hypothetical protein